MSEIGKSIGALMAAEKFGEELLKQDLNSFTCDYRTYPVFFGLVQAMLYAYDRAAKYAFDEFTYSEIIVPQRLKESSCWILTQCRYNCMDNYDFHPKWSKNRIIETLKLIREVRKNLQNFKKGANVPLKNDYPRGVVSRFPFIEI